MKQKLLIVDDEQGIVDTMKSYFSAEYEILTACNGQEAVRKAQEQPDLILLDQHAGDGRPFRLQEHPGTCALPYSFPDRPCGIRRSDSGISGRRGRLHCEAL